MEWRTSRSIGQLSEVQEVFTHLGSVSTDFWSSGTYTLARNIDMIYLIASLNRFCGFFLMIWFISPLLYFNNFWDALSFDSPIGPQLYNKAFEKFDISAILDPKTLTLDLDKWESREPLLLTP